MAADIAVYPRGGCGIDKIDGSRIDCFKFRHQLPVLTQLIFLMVVFRQVESVERQNFGVYFPASALLLQCLGFQGQLSLGFIVIEYCRYVLPTPGAGGRIMFPPENIEKILMGYPGWIEIQLDRFAVISNAAIGRGFLLTARIADTGSDDPV